MTPRHLIEQFKEYIRLNEYTQQELLDRLERFFELGVITTDQKTEITTLINDAFA